MDPQIAGADRVRLRRAAQGHAAGFRGIVSLANRDAKTSEVISNFGWMGRNGVEVTFYANGL